LSAFPSTLASIHPANYGAPQSLAARIGAQTECGDCHVLRIGAAVLTTLFAAPAANAAALPGEELSLLWIIPFAGILLSIALIPLIAPRFWEHQFGAVSLFWILAIVGPMTAIFGVQMAWNAVLHTLLVEYLPFIILLFVLFVVAGGISVSGNIAGTPKTNVAVLAFGAGLASAIGTTGASMLLIRPMIRANQHRRHKVHVFIFFIFLVSNIGGSLTPLGDPPLFLGFLKGVDFFWTLKTMLPAAFVAGAILLAVFYLVDEWHWRRERHEHEERSTSVSVRGTHNLLYLMGVVGAVLISGLWHPDIVIRLGPAELPLEGLLRDVALLAIAYLSWKTTRASLRIENAFSWKPMQEVAILFAAIFATIIPALAILGAGKAGAAAPLVELVSRDGQPINAMYFWLTGILSSFLDNAPTYLVFFNLAGGDAQQLMGPLSNTLLAISMGAVFMGANTYIGNAPNFMVKSICEERGIRMPSFFGYMAWSGAILVPLFVVLTWLFFR
jgi:Na+/H+ antiporter NhaD/arsenite permease-like protein